MAYPVDPEVAVALAARGGRDLWVVRRGLCGGPPGAAARLIGCAACSGSGKRGRWTASCSRCWSRSRTALWTLRNQAHGRLARFGT